MKKHWPKLLIVSVTVILIMGVLLKPGQTETQALLVKPQIGPFQVTVTTTGELQAKNSVQITGPVGARQVRVFEMKILRLIPEGTIVKRGDFVAELDRSELLSRIKDSEIELQKAESLFEQTALDTSLTLSKARDEQVNLRFAMEEARLRMEQSVYEAPSIRRQAEIDYEQAERTYERSLVNYETQVQQAIAKMREVQAELSKSQKQLDDLITVSDQFTISAPDEGMVVYKRNWRGERTTEGGTVSAWDPVVAELPDLSVMESRTYVNEVDIQKLRMGQKVTIGLDADPDKKLTGIVSRVANIGEQRPNSDAKVFEVIITVNESDSTLRPAMTTSNTIVIAEVPDAMYIPLETIHAADSLSYVYVRRGQSPVRQEIALGLINENEAIIEAGLEPDDRLYMSIPADTSGIAFVRLDLEPEQMASRSESQNP